MASESGSTARAENGRGSPIRRVIVSLEFLPGNTSIQTPITNEFSSHLPLTDLQWKSSSRSTTRTIETLNLDFRSFREITKDAPPQQIPINLLERPYLHLLFVASDDNENYRVTLRPQIREWLNAVQKKKLQEWLIVHVTSQKTGPAKFYQRKGSVFDKIRADFNVGKRGRVLQLPVPGSQADETATDYASIWKDFLSKSKESIILSFDGVFTSYEEDVRKVDSQRQMPGWNFCTFFIQKEGLAHSFEAMNLLEDALIQYDELEASYYLGAKDQSLPWFSRIGGNQDKDDSLSILSSQDKPYRDLIVQNDISVFDFRIYLFSRQASLVSGLGRVVDLAKRAKFFIYNMAKMLRSHQGVLKKYFIESWIFTASLEVVNKCNQLLNSRKMNAAAIPDFLPILAELTELATRQVEKLGMVFGYLPRTHPFLMSSQSLPVDELDERDSNNGEEALDTPRHFESSNPELENSFKTEAAFDTLYRSMLDCVHEAWSGSLRTRSANKVKGTLAALEQARSHTKRALDIYATLVKDFNRTQWSAIEAQLLRQTLVLREGATDTNGQTEKLLAVLALIRNGLSTGSLKWTLETRQTDGSELASSLLAEARKLSEQLDKVVDVPAFTVTLASSCGHHLEQEDGLRIQVTIISHLPCAIDVDEVRLKLLSMAEEPLWLKSGTLRLIPGSNAVIVSAMVSLVGAYVLETSQIRTSRIVFQHSHRTALPSTHIQAQLRADLASTKQPIINFTQDPFAVDITATEALETSLAKPRQFVLTLHSGRGAMTKATVYLPGSSDKTQMLYETAEIVHGDGTLVADPDKPSLSLSSISRKEDIEISISYHSLSGAQHVFIPVTMEYHTTEGPEKRRLLKTCIRLRTALPLDVTVHDYRRKTFLLSKFTVSTTQRLPLRIKDALLDGTSQFKIAPPCKKRARSVVIKRDQSGSFPFRLERQEEVLPAELGGDGLKMSIKFVYRTVEADLTAILKPHLSTILTKHKVHPSRRLIEAISSLLLADTFLVNHFNNLHVLDLPGVEDVKLSNHEEPARLSNFKDSLRSYWTTDDEWDRIHSAIIEAYQTSVPTSLLLNEPWYSVSIPFEVPTTAIFSRVSLGLPSLADMPIRIGEHIPCTLYIDSTFDWGSIADRQYFSTLFDNQSKEEDQSSRLERGQEMMYEMRYNQNDWGIVGKTRGTYTISAMSGARLELPIELVPLREGNLFVPSVMVIPLPPPQEEGQLPPPQESQDNVPSSETYQDDVATYIEIVDDRSTTEDFRYSSTLGEVTYPSVVV